jgi:hypothetical protein
MLLFDHCLSRRIRGDYDPLDRSEGPENHWARRRHSIFRASRVLHTGSWVCGVDCSPIDAGDVRGASSKEVRSTST